MNKPILFLIFNRPDTTKSVFNAIRQAKPKKLYIAADGPRNNKLGEKEKCEETRKITENIDWPCEVTRLYRKNNLGCKLGVSSAITWFFDNVEEGIILEDDCLPNQSFFVYCSVLLEKFRHNPKIMHIGGNCFLKEKSKNSIYFSRYPHIWGWATWRRAWKKYDIKMDDWPKNIQKISRKYCGGKSEMFYWKTIFDKVKHNQINTWDYQWLYSIWNNNGISISPTYNLVKNIGFSSNATHTKKAGKLFLNMKTNKITFPLDIPKIITFNDINDKFTADNVYNINKVTNIYLYISYLFSKFVYEKTKTP